MSSALVRDYVKFTDIRNSCKGKMIDLSSCTWMSPTTLLPLINYLRNKGLGYKKPKDPNLSSYMAHIMSKQNGFRVKDKTYVPLTFLPVDREDAKVMLDEIFALPELGKDCGGEQAVKYVISELVDNVYQHSDFKCANIIAQKYTKLGFVDISIFDDGISIPGCFEKAGMILDDGDALIEAINGLSTKEEDRGFGLYSCVKMFTRGINGEIFIVSRNGAILLKGAKATVFKLQDSHKLKGTLITIRVPISPAKVNIYDYVR
jgi:hypothetical protein